jgi:hypothetical protein
MNEHPAAAVLASFARAELHGSDLLAVDDHIAGCADCRTLLRSPEMIPRAADAWRAELAGEHLSYERLEACIDGTAGDDGAAIEQHISICEQCASEVQDLRSYRRLDRARPYKWIAIAAAAALAIVTPLVLLRSPSSVRHAPSPPRIPTTATVPAGPTLRDAGVTFAIGGDGSVAGLSPAAQATLSQLRSGVIPSLALLAELRPAAQGQRGTGEGGRGLAVSAPLGVVADDRPLFEWHDDGGAATYAVEVVDATYHPVASSGAIRGRSWRPDRSLPRGVTLEWQVTRTREDTSTVAPAPPEPPARLRVISGAALAELRDAKARRSHLLATLVYAREGMLDSARAELAQLAALNPQSSIVEQLRRTLDERRVAHEPEPTSTNPAQ